jgi:conjugative transfer signal peptidase TraF
MTKARTLPALATALLIGLLIATYVLHALGLRVNTTESEPLGIYWMQPYKKEEGTTLAKGDLIEFCPAIRQQDYPFTPKGPCDGGTRPFLKQVIGTPGDQVRADERGVTVNGQFIPDSQPKNHSEATQTRLPHWRGDKPLDRDEYWVYGSQNPQDSFDSRYYGPIKVRQILSVRPAIH